MWNTLAFISVDLFLFPSLLKVTDGRQLDFSFLRIGFWFKQIKSSIFAKYLNLHIFISECLKQSQVLKKFLFLEFSITLLDWTFLWYIAPLPSNLLLKDIAWILWWQLPLAAPLELLLELRQARLECFQDKGQNILSPVCSKTSCSKKQFSKGQTFWYKTSLEESSGNPT